MMTPYFFHDDADADAVVFAVLLASAWLLGWLLAGVAQ